MQHQTMYWMQVPINKTRGENMGESILHVVTG